MSGNTPGARIVALGLAVISTGCTTAIWNMISLNELGRDAWLLLAIFYFWWRQP